MVRIVDGQITTFALLRFTGFGMLVVVCSGVLIAPLLFNNLALSWDRHINTLYFYFFVSVAVLCASTLLLWSGKMSINRIDMFVVTFFAYLLIRGTAGNREHYWDDQHVILFSLFCVYLVFKILLLYVPVLMFVYTLIIACFVNAFLGMMQFAHIAETNNPTFAITGFFSNPGPFAAYLTLAIPFIVLCRPQHTRFVKLFLLAALLLIIVAIVFSTSRAALIAGTFSLVAALYHLRKSGGMRWHRKDLRLALCFCCLLFLFLAALFYLKSDSSLGRLLIWHVSINMISENWLFGAGPGQFAVQYSDYQALYLSGCNIKHFEWVAGMTYYAFNDWLQLAAEGGLCGVVPFALLFAAVLSLKISAPAAQAARVCIFSTVAGLSMFFYPMQILAVQVVVIFSLALLSFYAEQEHVVTGKKFSPLVTRMMALLFIAVSVFATLQLHSRYRAVQQWKDAYTVSLLDRTQALSRYRKLLPLLAYNGEFLFNYGALLVEGGRPADGEKILRKALLSFNHIDLHLYLGNAYKMMGKFEAAKASYSHASQMIPTRFYPKYQLVLLYKDFQDTARAKKTAQEIVDMDIKVPSPLVDQIRQEMKTFLAE
jgi:O-antigen polymerase